MKTKTKTNLCCEDIIDDEDLVAELRSSTDPQSDSPGDSESDAGSEFLMGLNYKPERKGRTFSEDLDFTDYLPDTAKVVSSEQPSPWKDLDSNSDTN